MRSRNFLNLILNFLLAIAICEVVIFSTYARQNPNPQQPTNANTGIDIDRRIQEEVSKETSKLWKEQSEQHFNAIKQSLDSTQSAIDKIDKLATFALTAISLIIAVLVAVAGLFGFSGFKTYQRFKKNMKKVSQDLDNRLQTINEQAVNLSNIEKQVSILQIAVEKKSEEVNSLITQIQEKNEEIFELLSVRKATRNKKIIWVISTEGIDDSEIINDLKKDGFKNISEWKLYSERELALKDDCDFMVFSYALTSDIADRLEIALNYLASINRRIPLIVYTYHTDDRNYKFPMNETQMLDNYKDYTFAGMPGSFKSHFYSLIQAGSSISDSG